MDQTKITIKIYEPLLKFFDDQLDRLFIKRDAFLNHMIKKETLYLAQELADRRLSPKARRFVAGQLKKLGTRTVNVVVDKETAEALNQVVDRCNLVRDAFINRLILLLRSSDSFLRYQELPLRVDWAKYDYEDCFGVPLSPLSRIEDVINDPLFHLREEALRVHETGLYLLELPDQLIGFSCFLEDWRVPGTQENKEAAKRGEEILDGILLALEKQAFGSPQSPEEGK